MLGPFLARLSPATKIPFQTRRGKKVREGLARQAPESNGAGRYESTAFGFRAALLHRETGAILILALFWTLLLISIDLHKY